MKHAKIWLLYLVFPFAYGRLLTALVFFSVLLTLFMTLKSQHQEMRLPALFFSAILAYSIAIFSLITEKTQEAFDELSPFLQLDHATVERLRNSIGCERPITSLIIAAGGLGAGCVHLILMYGSPLDIGARILGDPLVAVGYTVTLLLWLVLTTLISSLVGNATLFSRLGARSVTIDLLDTRPLVAFSRVAIISSLAIIGAQALFPLLYLDQEVSWVIALPGLLSMSLPMLALFAIPLWPIHRRLVVARAEKIDLLSQRIRACEAETPNLEDDPETLERVNGLLQMRREIVLVPVWPFDAGSITRLLLYIVIVPLTWAGAALIEMLVEALL